MCVCVCVCVCVVMRPSPPHSSDLIDCQFRTRSKKNTVASISFSFHLLHVGFRTAAAAGGGGEANRDAIFLVVKAADTAQGNYPP